MFGDKSVGLTASARKIETFFLLLDFFPCHQKDIFCKKKRLKIFVGDGGIFLSEYANISSSEFSPNQPRQSILFYIEMNE